jgi:Tfp pilus assembly protein PilX
VMRNKPTNKGHFRFSIFDLQLTYYLFNRKSEIVNRKSSNRSGVVLLITLVLLVILATLGYTLSNRVATHRHRQQYIIDYSQARYACDSAVKYALANLKDINPQLISRPNEPDFSDLFVLGEVERRELLGLGATENTSGTKKKTKNIRNKNDVNEASDSNDINAELTETGLMMIRGPYGPAWPLVSEPVEFDIASATVKMEIEDENAKYPIGWLLLEDPETKRETTAGFQTFCEWMGLKNEVVKSLQNQLKQISEIKPFQVEFKPVKQTVSRPITPRRTPTVRNPKGGKTTVSRTYRRPVTTKTISVPEQKTKQNADFARLLHCSLIDTEALARPYMDDRDESALKYLGMWASSKVNINTAPRHVLEAAFAFAGLSEATEIAERIIQLRRIQPFTDIENLKRDLSRYSDAIGKCEKYITTTSDYFTIKITAISGVAKASATIAVMKDGKQVKRTAVISG